MFIEVTREDDKKVSLNGQYIKYFNSNSEDTGSVIVLYTTSSSDLSVIKVKESYIYLKESLKLLVPSETTVVNNLQSKKVASKETPVKPNTRRRTPKKAVLPKE